MASFAVVADPLTEHLRRWIGAWPPTSGLQVIGHPGRTRPGWDGRVAVLRGLSDGSRTVIGVPPGHEEEVRRLLLERRDQGQAIVAHLGFRPAVLGSGVYRWTVQPAPLRELGTWVDQTDPRLPEWLRPFNGGVLAVFDARGQYVAGVGRKIHDRFGHEIAVGTTSAARGKGLARRLVVTAARRILAEGAVPTYLHEPSNVASAKVADAAGFRDRGWRVHGLWPTG